MWAGINSLGLHNTVSLSYSITMHALLFYGRRSNFRHVPSNRKLAVPALCDLVQVSLRLSHTEWLYSCCYLSWWGNPLSKEQCWSYLLPPLEQWSALSDCKRPFLADCVQQSFRRNAEHHWVLWQWNFLYNSNSIVVSMLSIILDSIVFLIKQLFMNMVSCRWWLHFYAYLSKTCN